MNFLGCSVFCVFYPVLFFRHKIVAFYNSLTYNIFGGKMGIIFILDIKKLPESACLAPGGDVQ
jgi:hypothetical protein